MREKNRRKKSKKAKIKKDNEERIVDHSETCVPFPPHTNRQMKETNRKK